MANLLILFISALSTTVASPIPEDTVISFLAASETLAGATSAPWKDRLQLPPPIDYDTEAHDNTTPEFLADNPNCSAEKMSPNQHEKGILDNVIDAFSNKVCRPSPNIYDSSNTKPSPDSNQSPKDSSNPNNIPGTNISPPEVVNQVLPFTRRKCSGIESCCLYAPFEFKKGGLKNYGFCHPCKISFQSFSSKKNPETFAASRSVVIIVNFISTGTL